MSGSFETHSKAGNAAREFRLEPDYEIPFSFAKNYQEL
jgi:hypothetical protein